MPPGSDSPGPITGVSADNRPDWGHRLPWPGFTFVTAPGWMWRGGNPLLLTTDGEFVLKNLVLISAALVLLGVSSRIRTSTAEGRVASRA